MSTGGIDKRYVSPCSYLLFKLLIFVMNFAVFESLSNRGPGIRQAFRPQPVSLLSRGEGEVGGAGRIAVVHTESYEL